MYMFNMSGRQTNGDRSGLFDVDASQFFRQGWFCTLLTDISRSRHVGAPLKSSIGMADGERDFGSLFLLATDVDLAMVRNVMMRARR